MKITWIVWVIGNFLKALKTKKHMIWTLQEVIYNFEDSFAVSACQKYFRKNIILHFFFQTRNRHTPLTLAIRFFFCSVLGATFSISTSRLAPPRAPPCDIWASSLSRASSCDSFVLNNSYIILYISTKCSLSRVNSARSRSKPSSAASISVWYCSRSRFWLEF
mgnify:CR=1 FL=1